MLRALTVLQPYASAIALADPRELGPELGKTVENRGWPPWPSVVGQYVAIHAGKAPADAEDVIDVGRLLYPGDDEILRAWEARVALGYGRILCVARVVGSTRYPTRTPSDRWRVKGQIGWLLEDVRALLQPVEARGAQGLWLVPEAIEAQVRAQVGL